MSEPHLPRRAWFSLLLTRLVIGFLVALPAGLLVMFLWNEVVIHAINGANRLNFWQALGLLVLCRVLFSGSWIAPGRPAPAQSRKRRLPEEDRAAFLSRIRQRLSETDVRPGAWGPGGHE